MPSNECYACKKALLLYARRCDNCHAWQDWRRYTGDLNVLTVVPLIASAIAIVMVLIDVNNTDNRVKELETRFLYDTVYEKWKEGNGLFIEKNGIPSSKIEPINLLWYQFFEKGYILFNASSGWSVALSHEDMTFSRMNNPEQLIALYDPKKIDQNLLQRLHNEERYNEYLRLFETGEITGGIGTLYVKHDLAPIIGKPTGKEISMSGAAFIRGQTYDLIVGAINRPTDSPNSSIRAVYALFHGTHTYEKFPVNVGRE